MITEDTMIRIFYKTPIYYGKTRRHSCKTISCWPAQCVSYSMATCWNAAKFEMLFVERNLLRAASKSDLQMACETQGSTLKETDSIRRSERNKEFSKACKSMLIKQSTDDNLN